MGTWVGTNVTVCLLCAIWFKQTGLSCGTRGEVGEPGASCTQDPAVLWDWTLASVLFENLTKMPSSSSLVFSFHLCSCLLIYF